jgi:hypothetical protein
MNARVRATIAPSGRVVRLPSFYRECCAFARVLVVVVIQGRQTPPRCGKGEDAMMSPQAQSLRKAIEGLIDAKLHDALARPGGLDRLTAHRVTGVASYDIRMAERRLEQALADVLEAEEYAGQEM